MIGIGVIGYGYWGPNWVRNFADLQGARMLAVCDLRDERRALAQQRHPAIQVYDNVRNLLSNNDVDAVVVATPISTHFELGMQVLKAGKHLLMEKPLVATTDQGRQLIDEAAKQNKLLMVDHTFIYSGAVRKIKELVSSGRLGQIYYYDSVRVNLGLVQRDVNVLWDLAVHDLSIMDHILDKRPCAVSAHGTAHINGQEDIAYLTCFYEDNLIAHLHVNWLAPAKVRRTLIGGAKQMVVYDDLEPSEKVKVYDKGVTVNNNPEGVYQLLVGYRTGDMWAPQIDTTEALRVEAQHFVECIEAHKQPMSDGLVGLRTVQILQAASESLRRRGQPVDLVW